MVVLAIDGACRGNGRPDCLSTGALYVKRDGEPGFYQTTYEKPSTNQRGELQALILALEEATQHRDTMIYIISDSEYIVNCMTKEWYKNWQRKGWITAAGEPVKNRDLWERVVSLISDFDDTDIVFYHIKGHVVSLGKVTATNLLAEDKTCDKLLKEINAKYPVAKHEKLKEAWELFIRNNGFEPPKEVFQKLICVNTVVDYIASIRADELQYVEGL